MGSVSGMVLTGLILLGGVARSVSAAEIALVPVKASGAHTIVGNQISLVGGGQRVFFEVRISGWDPNLDGNPLLRAWQAAIDSSGYSSGTVGVLAPALAACGSGADCLSAFGGACSISGTPCSQDADCPLAEFGEVCIGSPCSFPVGVGGFCAPGFILSRRTDYVFRDVPGSEFPGVDLSSNDYRFFSAAFPNSARDPGAVRYAATLVLDIPADAMGTFRIGFLGSPRSVLVANDNSFIQPLTLTPALVVILCVSNTDCNDQNFCTTDTCRANGECSNAPNFNQTANCCDPRTGETCGSASGVIGDGDGDGRVDLRDFAILQRRCFGTDLILFRCESFDADCNCRVDLEDVFDYTSAMNGPVAP